LSKLLCLHFTTIEVYLPNISNSLSSSTLNNPPNVPNSPSPPDGAIGLGTAVTLRWAGGDPDGNRVTYDIYGNATTGEPTTLVAIDHANTFYNLNGLIPNTPYAWKIIARDELGITTVGPIWRFVTAPVAPFQISLSTNSDKAYQLQKKGDGNGVSVGSKVYTDRDYTYATIPATLQGATYIITSNDDKSKSDLSLVITVNRSVQVYVAHSDQQTAKPAWLSSFQDTGENLTFIDNENRTVVLSTFTAVFPAGDIVLGGNASGGTVNSMYSVVIKETTSIAE